MSQTVSESLALTLSEGEMRILWIEMEQHDDEGSQRESWKSDQWKTIIARIRVQLIDQGFQPVPKAKCPNCSADNPHFSGIIDGKSEWLCHNCGTRFGL